MTTTVNNKINVQSINNPKQLYNINNNSNVSSTIYKPYFTENQLHILALIIRLILVFYGDTIVQLLQNNNNVKYSDIDYTVYADAGEYVHNNQSPYNRATYRYTPLLAYICTLNITIHYDVGKIIFCLFDILCSIVITKIIKLYTINNKYIQYSLYVSLFNPLFLTVSTRGNADTIITTLCILCMYYICIKQQYIISGIIYAIAIHFKIYPIIYLPIFIVYMSDNHKYANSNKHNNIIQYVTQLIKSVLFTNVINKLLFVLSTLITLSSLTYVFYILYGYDFLYNSYLYHVSRIDHRHNFSIWFYSQYINYVNVDNTQYIANNVYSLYITLLQLFSIICCTLYMYNNNSNKNNNRILHVCISLFALTNLFVHNNRVITAQYFLWYIVYMPLFMPYILQHYNNDNDNGNDNNRGYRSKFHKLIITIILWFITEALWLSTGYNIEFKSKPVFIYAHIASLLFYTVNIYLVSIVVQLCNTTNLQSTISHKPS